MNLPISRFGGLRGLVIALMAGTLWMTAASADPLPLSVVGAPPNMIKVSTSGPLAFPLNNGGGGFQGTVWEGQAQSGPSHTTTMWCIDSQLTFSNNNSGLANITLLSSLPTAEARYGTISQPASVGTPGWTNGFGGALDSAQARFQMAAWLVQQYSSFPTGPTPSNDSRSISIQRAIWATMHNNTPGATASGFSNAGAADVAPWINLAKANYSSVNLSTWAIVSWIADADGGFTHAAKQTFLVQVVPEPGFYLVLGLGLGLLLLMHRRRQAGMASAL